MGLIQGRTRVAPSLENVSAAVLAVCVVLTSCGSSSVASVVARGQSARWGALLLLVVASGVAVRRARGVTAGRLTVAVGGIVGVLVVVALLSATWSIAPRLTFERAVSFGALLVAGVGFAYAAPSRPALPRALVAGIVAGASFVAFLGLVVLAFDHADAVQAATAITPWRYRGFGLNPDTIPMLAAVALPPAVWLAWSGLRRGRALATPAVLLLLGTIGFSGSRGGAIAAAAGIAAFGLVLSSSMRGRLVAAVATAAVILGSVALGHVATVTSNAPTVAVPAAPSVTGGSGSGSGTGHHGKAAQGGGTQQPVSDFGLGRLEDELDRPGPSGTLAHRSIFSTSGRLEAWAGAFHTGNSRPFLGFGFGTEERSFVDRYFNFQGSRPENSWLGMYLQLGAVGVLLLLAIWLSAGVVALRAVRGRLVGDVALAAALAGAVVAAVVLSLVQSYLYSVGNVATVAVWVSLFLLIAAPAAKEPVADVR